MALEGANEDYKNNPPQRVECLQLLVLAWSLAPEKIEDNEMRPNHIISLLTKGVSSNSKMLNLASLELMLELIEMFA
jgi:hypothetical protein